MLVVITYDVSTETAAGQKRLRRVARECQNYGQRVQNSVFECHLDSAELRTVEAVLEKIIDKEKDSLRFYVIGSSYEGKVKHTPLRRCDRHADFLICHGANPK